uniref:Reverse transcriptase domain-containing protein n=1 Tax=Tanacetum cinerariifolium TaxID=118510 RepID=A0A699GIU9_TANCI|nr:reverse transcriptase domain-containing protein [Tanacetum cinerariifolium]
MRTRSSSNLPVVSSNPSTSNPKRRNRRRSKQPFNLEESPVDTMADQRTMAELLRAPTEGYAEAIVVPSILAEQFELKHSLINMMTTDQFFRLEKYNPHDHIRWFNKITSTIKYKDVPNSAIKLMLFPFSLAGAAHRWLEKEPPHSIHTWEGLVSKFINEFFPPQEQQISVMKSLIFNNDQDSLNAAAGGNLLERQIAKLTHAVNQQTSAMTTAMTAMLKQFQATPPPAFVKVVEETCVTCRGAHPYYQCLAAGMANQIRPPGFAQPNVQNNQNRFGPPQGFNRGNNFNPEHSYQAPAQQNQNVHLNELEKVRRMNDANIKAMQTQIDMVKKELRNEMKNSIQTSLLNQTNEIKNMMASLLQMNTASTSGGIVLDGPTIPTPPQSINPEVDERVEETFTDPDLAEYTIKVPPPPVQKYKPPYQREYDLHINITLADGLILMPKYQKMLKALLSNKEKLQELANTPLNENCSAVILKKLPQKIGDLRKFLIPCGFSELKCKALADLGASINLMSLSIWKKLGLPELISTCMTLELANRAIYTPAGIAKDVFILVGKFTFIADFIIVDYDSDPRVPLILGRPFLRTACALIDVHAKRHPTFSSNPELTSPKVNDAIFDSEGSNVLPEKLLDLDFTKDLRPPLHDDPLSGNPTYSSSPSPLLEEFADELSLITFPPKYDDDIQFDIEPDLIKIEFLLHQDLNSSLKDSTDQSNLANLNDIFVDSIPEMFTDEHALDYSSPLIFDEYDDDFFKVEFDAENVYDDPFDSKRKKIKESKLLIDELDLPCDFLPFEYDSFISQDFSRVDSKPSTDNEDKGTDMIKTGKNPRKNGQNRKQNEKRGKVNSQKSTKYKNVPVTEGSSETTTERIDNDIYSIVDVCPNACEMWKAIERLKQGESINVQNHETKLYWEFGKFTLQDGESLESYYLRFYKMMNELVKNQCDSQELKTVSYHKLKDILKQHQNEVNELRTERLARTANLLALVAQQQPIYHPQNHHIHYTQNSSTRSQQAATKNRGKAIVNSPSPIYDQEPTMVTEDDEMSKDNEIDKLMALISLSVKKIYKPTNNNLRTSSNTSRANQDNSLRINKGIRYDNQRIVNVAGARENVEQADWKDDTDDEPEDQELEAHYIEHPEQSKFVNDTYLIKQDEHNMIIDSLDMSYDREQVDEDDEADLAIEHDLLASLIEKLRCKVDESKNSNNFLETSNKALVGKLKGEIEDFKSNNKSLESSNNHFKEANNKLSKTNELMYKDLKKF